MMRLAAVALALALLAAPLAAEAQLAGTVPRIGFISAGTTPPFGPLQPSWSLGAFRQGLHALGYVDGRDFLIESRFADSKLDRLPALAADLVALKVDVIVTVGTPTAKAVKAATATIPIVMAGVTDPVENGIVASLGRPGGNVTGTAYTPGPDIAGKALELFKQAVPRMSRVAVPWDSSGIAHGAYLRAQQRVAPKLGIALLPHDAKTLAELTAALDSITREQADGLFVFGGFINSAHSELILDFATRNRLPTMYDDAESVKAGGLMSYATDGNDVRRRAATFVDKILKGAKPADLPIEQPTKFEFVINLKTAKALGLTIPPSVLARADEVIQ